MHIHAQLKIQNKQLLSLWWKLKWFQHNSHVSFIIEDNMSLRDIPYDTHMCIVNKDIMSQGIIMVLMEGGQVSQYIPAKYNKKKTLAIADDNGNKSKLVHI